MEAMIEKGWTAEDASRALDKEEEDWLRQPIHTLTLS